MADDIHHIGYLDKFARLPSSTPRNRPHILDLTTFKEHDGNVVTDIMLQDAIVTTLHQISAETLTNFLDATSPFRIVFKCKGENMDDSLVIMRKDDQVIVGMFAEYKYTVSRVFECDNLIRLTIDQDGAWKITDATYRDCFPSDWAAVWAGNTINNGYGAFNIKTKEGDPARAMFVRQTADYLLARQWWDPTYHTWTITTT